MATISFRDFSQGQPVKTLGEEGKVQIQEQNGGQKLFSQLGERAKTFGKEAVTLGTLGASTMTPQDLQATGQDRTLASMQALNRAGQAPIRMAGAVGGAISDVVGAGLEATGLAEPIGQALAPIAESQPVQKAMEVFKSLPQDTQEVLGAIVNTANIPIGGAGVGIAKKGVQTGLQTAKEAVTPLTKTVLPKLTPDAEEIMQRVARVSKGKQANFEQRAGESIGSFLDKRGIYGDIDQISEQLYNRFQKSKQTADEALASLKGNYQPEVVGTALAELESKLKRVSSPGAVDPQLSEVTGLLAKYKNQGLTMSEINQAKRLYERNVKLDFLKENNPEGVKIANNIDESIRKWQFSQAEKLGLKNLPEINKETMLTRQLLDDIGREYAGSAGNNLVTLTDWIVLSGGDATAVAGFLMKQGLSSKKVQSFIAKMISKNVEKKGVPTPQTGEATVLPIGTYKDFLKETSKNAKPTTQPPVEKGLKPSSSNVQPKEGVVNELINKPLRGSVTPSEFLPKKKAVSKFENAEDFVRSKGFTIHDRVIDNYSGENIGEIAIRDKNGKAISAIEYGKFGNESPNIKMVVTKPEYQRQGLATALYKRLQELYPDSGVEIGMRTPEGSAFHSNLNKKLADLFETKSGKVSRTPMGMTASPSTTITNDSTKQLGGKKVINTLEQEAKKYKSAEVFVKAQGTPVYHGTNAKFDVFDETKFKNGWLGKGAYFTSNKTLAKENGKILKEATLNIKNPFIIKGNSPSDVLLEIKNKFPEVNEFNISEVLKKNGYDSIKFNHWDKGEMTTVFSPNQIKTKSQLTDIWKKANKK